MKKTGEFVKKLYNKDGSFSFSPLNKVSNLYSTCFGIMCLDLINQLNYINKEKTINLILKFQDKKTGYFLDKNCIQKTGHKHDKDYLTWQLTDFAQMALSTLNAKPKHKYNFLKKYKNKNYLTKWFYSLNWKDPWLVSNQIMFLLNFFIYENKFKNKKYINHLIFLLNKNQDKKNGFWNLGKKTSFHNQMAGAYHFLFFYTYLDKKPRHIKKIIGSTLFIQDYDGLFNYAGGGGACDDLDAIDLLCRSTFYTSYKKEKIEEALQKAYFNLLKNKNEDGGFCWAKRDFLSLKKIINSIKPSLISLNYKDFLSNFKSKLINQIKILLKLKISWKYSGLDSMKLSCNTSDIWSTWARLLSIALIEETFPRICKNKKSFKWNMRNKCGLGFYKK